MSKITEANFPDCPITRLLGTDKTLQSQFPGSRQFLSPKRLIIENWNSLREVSRLDDKRFRSICRSAGPPHASSKNPLSAAYPVPGHGSSGVDILIDLRAGGSHGRG